MNRGFGAGGALHLEKKGELNGLVAAEVIRNAAAKAATTKKNSGAYAPLHLH
jgi:hypothetical protein